MNQLRLCSRSICMTLLVSLAGVCQVRAEKIPPLPDGAVTLVVIPDTQRYEGEGRLVKKGPPATGPVRNESFTACLDWILAHRESERIFFVSHVGDITDNRNAPQFSFAAKEMSRLDGLIPYGISPGNHDLAGGTSSDLFCAYFPASKFEKESWYAGHFGGYTNVAGAVVCRDNANSCQLVEAGGTRFVFLHIECNAPDPVLAWADEQLTKYQDRVAIVTTHQDLGFVEKIYQDVWNERGAKMAQRAQECMEKGEVLSSRPPHPDRDQLGRLRWKKCHGKEGNTPQQAWEKCYSKHGNLLMILSGDQGPVNVARDISVGREGNHVFSAMHDTQTHSIRLYRFLPGLKAIEVWSVDPSTGNVLSSYRGWTDPADHNFTWTLVYDQVKKSGPKPRRKK